MEHQAPFEVVPVDQTDTRAKDLSDYEAGNYHRALDWWCQAAMRVSRGGEYPSRRDIEFSYQYHGISSLSPAAEFERDVRDAKRIRAAVHRDTGTYRAACNSRLFGRRFEEITAPRGK